MLPLILQSGEGLDEVEGKDGIGVGSCEAGSCSARQSAHNPR